MKTNSCCSFTSCQHRSFSLLMWSRTPQTKNRDFFWFSGLFFLVYTINRCHEFRDRIARPQIGFDFSTFFDIEIFLWFPFYNISLTWRKEISSTQASYCQTIWLELDTLAHFMPLISFYTFGKQIISCFLMFSGCIERH